MQLYNTEQLNYTITLEALTHCYELSYTIKGWGNIEKYYFTGRGDKPFQVLCSNHNIFYYIIDMFEYITETTEKSELDDLKNEQAELTNIIANLINQ